MPRYLISSNKTPKSLSFCKKLNSFLKSKKWIEDKKNFDYLFVVGGDGAFVRNLSEYNIKNKKVFCVNTGSVGFYSSIDSVNLETIFQQVNNQKSYLSPKSLEVICDGQKFYSINECLIQSINTITLDILIDDFHYEKYRGSGVLIATRTGSTAQAKSNGGPIIFPNVDAYELLEIAPTNHVKHQCISSPIIVNGNTILEFTNFIFNQRCDLIIDGIFIKSLSPHSKISIKQITAPFKFCFSNKINNYINKLKKTFINKND